MATSLVKFTLKGSSARLERVQALVLVIQVVSSYFEAYIRFLISFSFSGGGYFVLHQGFWFMKGIVSAAAFKANGVCNVDTYSLYTNVGDFLDWIKDTVYETA